MKLMDKIKDLFMDEVVDDDEIELEEEEKEEYKEPPKEVLPKVMRENIEKEEKKSSKITPEEFIKVEKKEYKEPVKENPVPPTRKFTFPIDFEEEVKKAERKEQVPPRNDIPSRNNRNNIVNNNVSTKNNNSGNGNINVLNIEKEATKKVTELYARKEEHVKPKFKASPVISPVYGVLDKNYTKEEVREKSEDTNVMKRPSKKVDFETVRKKAFGNLADDIKDNLMCENCELYKEVKKISSLSEDDLLYDMTVDDDNDKDVTLEKAYDNYQEFGVAYEPKTVKKEVHVDVEEELVLPKELGNIIKDNDNKETEEKPTYVKMESKIDEDEELTEEETKEIEERNDIEDIPTREEKKKETKVDDDFFKLIDSMYKERTDD